jgi:hypothetical protein
MSYPVPPFNPSRGVAVNLATTDFTGNFGAIWVGTTGNIQVTGLDGVNVTFDNVPVGWFKQSGTAIIRAGTTATNLVAAN